MSCYNEPSIRLHFNNTLAQTILEICWIPLLIFRRKGTKFFLRFHIKRVLLKMIRLRVYFGELSIIIMSLPESSLKIHYKVILSSIIKFYSGILIKWVQIFNTWNKNWTIGHRHGVVIIANASSAQGNVKLRRNRFLINFLVL